MWAKNLKLVQTMRFHRTALRATPAAAASRVHSPTPGKRMKAKRNRNYDGILLVSVMINLYYNIIFCCIDILTLYFWSTIENVNKVASWNKMRKMLLIKVTNVEISQSNPTEQNCYVKSNHRLANQITRICGFLHWISHTPIMNLHFEIKSTVHC